MEKVVQKEKKELKFLADVRVSKRTSEPYLTLHYNKDNKYYFVNLVSAETNKRMNPAIKFGAKQVEITCTSYLISNENETNRIVLFGVSKLDYKF